MRETPVHLGFTLSGHVDEEPVLVLEDADSVASCGVQAGDSRADLMVDWGMRSLTVSDFQ